MKKIFLLLILFLFHFSFGQGKDSLTNKNGQKGQITINAGVGASFITLAAPGSNIISDELSAITESPAYNGTINYQFLRFMSVGIGCAYQWFTDNPQYGLDNVATWETEKITRLNVSGLLLFHFSKRSFNDFYLGLRIGESIWTDKVISDNNLILYPQSPVYMTMPTPTIQRGSFQVLCGYSYFPIYNLGMHLEFGIGTPYFLEAGFTFRFKTKK